MNKISTTDAQLLLDAASQIQDAIHNIRKARTVKAEGKTSDKDHGEGVSSWMKKIEDNLTNTRADICAVASLVLNHAISEAASKEEEDRS